MSRSDLGPSSSRLLVVRRRALLEGGLASFATVMMSRALGGCGGSDAGTDAGSDAAIDAGGASLFDAGTSPPFPPREMPAPPALVSRIEAIGPLSEKPDANGLRLPEGFTSRIIGRTGQPVIAGGMTWHTAPDGGATYATQDGGWIYVSNSEVPLLAGGVCAVRFDASGEIQSAYRILGETSINCAGGKTPWGSWLSCEEIPTGRVFECDPWGEHAAVPRPALGVFKHEAAAVDPVRAHVYLTEDESDGCFYRFVPDALTEVGHPNLAHGRLEVAAVDGNGSVMWRALPDPHFTGAIPTRMQIPESTVFRGGEGIWYHDDVVYFATKHDDRIWAYDVVRAQLRILYDGDAAGDARPIRGVDNLTVSCCGDVLVAEDGGSMRVVAILPSGDMRPLVQVVGHDRSEITGPAFDPSGTRLYFSSQRGSGMGGVTYEVTGPFHAPA